MAYDLAGYICPPAGKSYVLTSNEACRSIQAPDGWIEFRKNRLMEEFLVTNDVIMRGADTSMLYTPDGLYRGQFYVQYAGSAGTPVYGCAWAARRMDKGQVYHRKCRVIYYSYDGRVVNDYIEDSDLTLRDHHDSLMLPSGVVVPDVLELQYGGEEIYFYAKDCGLVGWRNLKDGSFGNYLRLYNVETMAPVGHDAVPRPPATPLMPAPVPVPAPVPAPPKIVYPNRADMGLIVTDKQVAQGPINVRDFPSTADGKVTSQINTSDVVTYHIKPSAVYTGHTWFAIEQVNGKVQTGWIATDVVKWALIAQKQKVTLDLGLVYVSQVDRNSNLKDNDCGVAAAISACLTRLRNLKYGAFPLLTVNNLLLFTTLAKGDGTMPIDQLGIFLGVLGVPATFSNQLTPSEIKNQLGLGNGVIALLNYVCLDPKQRFGHYANIAGLAENDTFVINDSYQMGEGFQIPHSQLEIGLTDQKNADGKTVFATKPYQGYILKLK